MDGIRQELQATSRATRHGAELENERAPKTSYGRIKIRFWCFSFGRLSPHPPSDEAGRQDGVTEIQELARASSLENLHLYSGCTVHPPRWSRGRSSVQQCALKESFLGPRDYASPSVLAHRSLDEASYFWPHWHRVDVSICTAVRSKIHSSCAFLRVRQCRSSYYSTLPRRCCAQCGLECGTKKREGALHARLRRRIWTFGF